MQIDFKYTGDCTNLNLNYHCDTDLLSKQLNAEIHKLVANSKFFLLQQNDVTPEINNPPDVINYTITLQTWNKSKTLLFNDVSIPESLHPFLALLRKLSLEKRKTINSS